MSFADHNVCVKVTPDVVEWFHEACRQLSRIDTYQWTGKTLAVALQAIGIQKVGADLIMKSVVPNVVRVETIIPHGTKMVGSGDFMSRYMYDDKLFRYEKQFFEFGKNRHQLERNFIEIASRLILKPLYPSHVPTLYEYGVLHGKFYTITSFEKGSLPTRSEMCEFRESADTMLSVLNGYGIEVSSIGYERESCVVGDNGNIVILGFNTNRFLTMDEKDTVYACS
jgi:hypothetical protein